MGIAFAALSTTLNITFNNFTQEAMTWDVGFVGSSATGTADGTSDTGLSCGIATITPSSVTVSDTTLSKPGDKCTYTLTVKNNGTIAANLSNINFNNPSNTICSIEWFVGPEVTCESVKYELGPSSTRPGVPAEPWSQISPYFRLESGESKAISLVVSYKGNSTQSTTVTQTGAKFDLVFSQA